MKLQKLYIPLLAILLAHCLTGCEKNNPFAPGTELPPETTTGANTFGCLVNGKVWRNWGFGSLGISEMNETRLQIAASRSVTDTLTAIHIRFWTDEISVGTYPCDSVTININYLLILGGPTGTAYEYSYAQEGSIEITRFDLEERIVSGRFNALLKLEGCEDIVITEGRFDLKM